MRSTPMESSSTAFDPMPSSGSSSNPPGLNPAPTSEVAGLGQTLTSLNPAPTSAVGGLSSTPVHFKVQDL